MRHPHARRSDSDNVLFRNRAKRLPAIVASAAVAEMMLPNLPRCGVGVDSMRYAADPVHSPPAERPWMQRQSTSRIGAMMPTV